MDEYERPADAGRLYFAEVRLAFVCVLTGTTSASACASQGSEGALNAGQEEERCKEEQCKEEIEWKEVWTEGIEVGRARDEGDEAGKAEVGTQRKEGHQP
jgi:hypothetical protein